MASLILPHSRADIGDPFPPFPARDNAPGKPYETRGVVGEPHGPAQQVDATLATPCFGRRDQAEAFPMHASPRSVESSWTSG